MMYAAGYDTDSSSVTGYKCDLENPTCKTQNMVYVALKLAWRNQDLGDPGPKYFKWEAGRRQQGDSRIQGWFSEFFFLDD